MEFESNELKSRVFVYSQSYFSDLDEILKIFERFVKHKELPNIDFSMSHSFSELLKALSFDSFRDYASIVVVIFCFESYSEPVLRRRVQWILMKLKVALLKNSDLKYMPKVIMCLHGDALMHMYAYQRREMFKYLHNFNSVNNLIILFCQYFKSSKMNDIIINLTRQQKLPIQTYLNMDYGEPQDPDINGYYIRFGQGLLNSFMYMTTTEACYLYSHNPALGLIFNHYKYYKSERKGSLLDVKRVKMCLRAKRIPVILSEDATLQDVRKCMNLMRVMDLGMFKSIVLFLMSHGDCGDIIYTKKGSYQLHKDIIAPLMANKSLRHANIIIFVNACRGSYDPVWADCSELEPNMHTDITKQSRRVVIFYSTKPGCVSYRDELNGSPFIQTVCDRLDEIFKELNLQDLAKDVESVMESQSFFENGTTEYCALPDIEHSFKVEYCCSKDYEHSIKLLKQRIKTFKRQHTKL